MSRARRSFWVLTAVTILATGLVAQALAAPAGPVTDVMLAASTLLLVVGGALLIRVVAYLSRSPSGPPPPHRSRPTAWAHRGAGQPAGPPRRSHRDP